MIINKIYRKYFEKTDWILSKIRIVHLKLKYPSISICKKTYFGNGCTIICMDNSILELNNVYVSNYSKISSNHGATVRISNGYIGPFANIVARKEIIIESNFSIAEMVMIRDQNHNFDFSETPIADQGFSSAEIHIKENVWIGAKSSILKGVTIGRDSVIAAHSLVNKSIEEKSLYAGTPATKKVKK
jgi:acetyltransferase-like isoleucine patch superfamily enzyme